MLQKELIYSPKFKAKFRKSWFYGLKLFFKIAILSVEYLIKALQKKTSIKVVDQYIEKFWKINFHETFTSLYVVGRENIKPNQPYIFMSNHESWMDFASMFGTIDKSLRMVSKESLVKIPIFGHAMLDAGFIAIDRQNRRKAILQLQKAKEKLNSGISIWIAPEGTRTRSGNLGEFKKGGFYLALDLNVPIVPVFIDGARKVMPPDSITVYTNKSITVHFMEPIFPNSYERSSIKDLVMKVRNAILERQKGLKNDSL